MYELPLPFTQVWGCTPVESDLPVSKGTVRTTWQGLGSGVSQHPHGCPRSVASAVAQGMEAAVIITICAQHRCDGGDAQGREGRTRRTSLRQENMMSSYEGVRARRNSFGYGPLYFRLRGPKCRPIALLELLPTGALGAVRLEGIFSRARRIPT
jgi:hypothetical protein